MSGFPGPWGVAGGWAIDLFLQRESRPHSDIDIALLRGDQRHLRARVAVAQVDKVMNHCLSPWHVDEELQPPVHELQATWPDGFHLEFLLNDQDHHTRQWIFRRDHRIRRPLLSTFLSSATLPYLAPEIVLLNKSKAPATRDDADLDCALPYLSVDQRGWLQHALSLTAPGHRWTEVIGH